MHFSTQLDTDANIFTGDTKLNITTKLNIVIKINVTKFLKNN